jgi:hypothetical protein
VKAHKFQANERTHMDFETEPLLLPFWRKSKNQVPKIHESWENV